MNKKLLVCSLISGLFACSATGVSAAYTFTDLGTLGGASSFAQGINNAGKVVGLSYISGDVFTHATLWNGSVATDLGAVGGVSSGANGINNLGQIAGYTNTDNSVTAHPTI
jgi:probable HAF family extracellular repeat protein